MATKLWIGLLLPIIGFLFLSYAVYAVRHGEVRMGGRYAGGKKIYRLEHPFAFWDEIVKYGFIGVFGLSPLVHPGGVQGWTRSISSLMAHADKLMMLFGAMLLGYAAWQVTAGISFGRHYQPISKKAEPKRFWFHVSRFFIFGLILIVLGSMGMEGLRGLMDN